MQRRKASCGEIRASGYQEKTVAGFEKLWVWQIEEYEEVIRGINGYTRYIRNKRGAKR